MVFSKFFKGKDAPPPEPEPEAQADGDEEESDAQEGEPEKWSETTWAERAAAILPTGSSTGSKRPDALYGDAVIDVPIGPTHFLRASGCHLDTADGETLVDCTMALGSVAIGYADPEITRAALEAVGSGNVSGLPSVLEVDVAERFCEFVPCAEKVQFLKTGAEATSAAVRLARTYTSREVVIGCGYFGWHDWSSVSDGVPAATKQNYRSVPFDDIAALQSAASEVGDKLAAIMLEPVIERLPSPEWIKAARAACDKVGAMLIFDEIKTGFRLASGGYQDYSDLKPDLAAFGKAMANGFPLSAVCGRADIMDAAKRTWISSTLAAESSALAAAYVVLEMHREGGVCEKLADIGKAMKKGVNAAITSSGVQGVRLEGLDQMWLLKFDSSSDEAHFLRAAAKFGALFKRGAYNFAALAHDEEALVDIEAAASNAFVEVQRASE